MGRIEGLEVVLILRNFVVKLLDFYGCDSILVKIFLEEIVGGVYWVLFMIELLCGFSLLKLLWSKLNCFGGVICFLRCYKVGWNFFLGLRLIIWVVLVLNSVFESILGLGFVLIRVMLCKFLRLWVILNVNLLLRMYL